MGFRATNIMIAAYIKGALFNVIANLEICTKQDLWQHGSRPYCDELGNLSSLLEPVRAKFSVIVKHASNLTDTKSRIITAADALSTTPEIALSLADETKESLNAIYRQAAKGAQIEARGEQIASTDTIDEIAAQTNLLALNAAIEDKAGAKVRALDSASSSFTSEYIACTANEAKVSTGKAVSSFNALADNTSVFDNVLIEVLHQMQDFNGKISQIAAATK